MKNAIATEPPPPGETGIELTGPAAEGALQSALNLMLTIPTEWRAWIQVADVRTEQATPGGPRQTVIELAVRDSERCKSIRLRLPDDQAHELHARLGGVL